MADESVTTDALHEAAFARSPRHHRRGGDRLDDSGRRRGALDVLRSEGAPVQAREARQEEEEGEAAQVHEGQAPPAGDQADADVQAAGERAVAEYHRRAPG